MLYKQRVKRPIEALRDSDRSFPKVLGIYGTCAGIDFLEYRSLMNAARKGRKPEQVEIGSLFAAFQCETMFSQVQKHPIIFDAIYENVKAKNFGEVEDRDG